MAENSDIILAARLIAEAIKDLTGAIEAFTDRGYVWLRVSGYPPGNLDNAPIEANVTTHLGEI